MYEILCLSFSVTIIHSKKKNTVTVVVTQYANVTYTGKVLHTFHAMSEFVWEMSEGK